jgi:zinc metalloprotease ZmpA
MKRMPVLVLAIAIIMSFSFLSMISSQANERIQLGREQAIERARLDSFGVLQSSEFRVSNPRAEFSIREAFADDLNMTHVRMEQQHEGVKVFQGELITHFKADGSVSSVTGDYYKNINISTTPKLSDSDAVVIAAKEFQHGLSSAPVAELMILPKNGKFHLAYRVELTDIDSNNPASQVYFVSATSGKILFQYDNLETATAVGSGKSLYSGTVALSTNSLTSGFEMRDPTRGGNYTIDMKLKTSGGTVFLDSDNVWGTGLSSNSQSAAADAHYGVQVTFDYFKNVHGRNGIANDGRGSYNRVHYSRRYNNAFWSDSCFCMTYGDGDGSILSPLVSLDVAAHEMSHGVTSRTARLVYSGESGGLNEATSDIFGAAAEFYANNANDAGDWLIGEKIYLGSRGYLRSMSNPRGDGASIDHYSQYRSGMDVHYSSGLGNHFFYLLSAGGTNKTSNQTVAGIGIAKAEKIWYRALTAYMTTGTTYAQARTATLNAAADLYGAGSAEQSAVAATWTACGVN